MQKAYKRSRVSCLLWRGGSILARLLFRYVSRASTASKYRTLLIRIAALVVHLLEDFSMSQLGNRDQQGSVDSSWIPLSLHDGGVPLDLLYQVYDDLFQSKVGHTRSAELSNSESQVDENVRFLPGILKQEQLSSYQASSLFYPLGYKKSQSMARAPLSMVLSP
jgi:hypothetical protein